VGGPDGLENGFDLPMLSVDMAVEADAGVLDVTADGNPLPNSNMQIKGDTGWVYNVK
jgi:hypothetical protein